MIIKSDISDIQSYLVDAANIKGTCNSLIFPETVDELLQIVQDANKEDIPVTISAGRTGLTGGSVPESGNLISLEKLNKIISIDHSSETAVVQPGVILSDFQKEVELLHLFYPPDPTETNATIGGTVATNASGSRTFKYGPTRSFVEEIEVILPFGELTNIKRGESFINGYEGKITLESQDFIFRIPNYSMPNVKHAAGYFCKKNMDVIDLFIGAEGTLGIITKVKLKLINLPQNILSMIIFFENENDIFSFVKEVKSKSIEDNSIIDLREIEFFDAYALNLLADDYPNIPPNSKGAIWIEQEYMLDYEDQIIEEITKTIVENNVSEDSIWFAMNENDRKQLKNFRHSIPLKTNEVISSRDMVKVGTDTAVPDIKFIDFYNSTKKLIEQNKIDYVVYGHIGNSHLHFNMLPKDKAEFNLSRKIYEQICNDSVQLGGTISAEHGIGKLKTKYLLNMFGEEYILQMAELKKQFDPKLILNIGNIVDQKFLQKVR